MMRGREKKGNAEWEGKERKKMEKGREKMIHYEREGKEEKG